MGKHKIPLKNFFGKEWRFLWRNESTIGNWYGVALNRIGMFMLRTSRKLIRKGGGRFNGKYYSNCSWCGDGGYHYGGLHHSYSRKGSRCTADTGRCNNKPYI